MPPARLKTTILAVGTIRVFMDDGTQYVVGPKGRMVGLPDGSIRIDGPVRHIGRSKKPRGRPRRVLSVEYAGKPLWGYAPRAKAR
jgi:hypothetical protein